MAAFHPKVALSESALHMFRDVEAELLYFPRAGGTRIARTSAGPIDPHTIRREATYLRFLSICEAYTDTVMIETLEARVPRPAVKEVLLMMEELEISASRGWPNRNAAFKKYYDVALSDYPGWASLRAAADVRNVIAHGLGRLTASQRSRADLSKKLAEIDVAIGGGRVHLTNASLSTLRDTCIGYVKYLDSAITA